MTAEFSLDIEHMARLLMVTISRGDKFAVNTLVHDIARQVKDAGGPDGTLEEQLRAMLASHEAMSKAGEEMPPDFILPAGDATGAAHVVIREVRPIVARLRKERDEARAELAARAAPIEPGQHMVEALARIVDRGDNGEDTARAVLSRLASMGEDDMPCVDEIVAHVEPDPDVDISDLRDDIAAAVAFIDARVLPILAAKDARIAELEAPVPDERIADPAERARLVARELRARGVWARVQGRGVEVLRGIGAFWYPMLWEDVATIGVCAIAGRIQREEAKRVQAWAGDEQ